MFKYIRQGWQGKLTFTQIMFGKYLERLDNDDVVTIIAYVGFYIFLLLACKSFSLQSIWIYIFSIYGIGFYVWLIKAFWGSANQSKSSIGGTLIRIFTILLPLISIILFVLILIYWIAIALINNFTN